MSFWTRWTNDMFAWILGCLALTVASVVLLALGDSEAAWAVANLGTALLLCLVGICAFSGRARWVSSDWLVRIIEKRRAR